MLIHPWDAALDEQEWRQWLAGTDRFGMLVVNNLDPVEAPLVVPNHFTLAGGELLLHLARPNPVWRHLEAAPQVRLVVVGDYAYIPGYWRTPAGAPLEDGVPTSYYASVQFVARPVVVDDPQGKADILTAQLADLQPEGRAAASPRRDQRVAPTRPELIRTRSDQHPRERHRDHLTFGGTPSSSAHLSSDHRHPARQPGPLGIAVDLAVHEVEGRGRHGGAQFGEHRLEVYLRRQPVSVRSAQLDRHRNHAREPRFAFEALQEQLQQPGEGRLVGRCGQDQDIGRLGRRNRRGDIRIGPVQQRRPQLGQLDHRGSGARVDRVRHP